MAKCKHKLAPEGYEKDGARPSIGLALPLDDFDNAMVSFGRIAKHLAAYRKNDNTVHVKECLVELESMRLLLKSLLV